MNPLTYVVVNLGIIGILYFGANKIGSGALLSGDVVALVNYMSQILVELVKLANPRRAAHPRNCQHGPRVAGAGYALDDGIPWRSLFRRMLLPMWRWRSTMCPCAIRARVRKACPM